MNEKFTYELYEQTTYLNNEHKTNSRAAQATEFNGTSIQPILVVGCICACCHLGLCAVSLVFTQCIFTLQHEKLYSIPSMNYEPHRLALWVKTDCETLLTRTPECNQTGQFSAVRKRHSRACHTVPPQFTTRERGMVPLTSEV